MNHDGWQGSLQIRPGKEIRYVDSRGAVRYGQVASLTNRGQTMVFFIDFPEERQYFTAHIFSWDKTKMAGTTVSNGRQFGMFATKTSSF